MEALLKFDPPVRQAEPASVPSQGEPGESADKETTPCADLLGLEWGPHVPDAGARKAEPETRAGCDDDDDAGSLSDDDQAVQLLHLTRTLAQGVSVSLSSSCDTSVAKLLQDTRALGDWAKQQLPFKDCLDEDLKERVQDVQDELNKFTIFVVDFVQVVREGTGKVKMLGDQASMLVRRGVHEIRRVEEGDCAWDPQVLKPSIESTRKQFESVKQFVEGRVEEIRQKCHTHCNGLAILALIDAINGASADDLRNDITKELAKNASHLFKQKQALTKQEIAVKFTRAELERCKLNGQKLEERLEQVNNDISSVEGDIAGLEVDHFQNLQEIREFYDDQRRRQQRESHKSIHAIDQNPQLMKLVRQSDEAMEEAAQHMSELTLSEIHPDPPVHFIFILDKSGSMRDARWKNLVQSLKTMAARRQQIPQRHKDKVSVIMYHNHAWVSVFNKSWNEALSSPHFADDCFWGPTFFAPAFEQARIVASKVTPAQGLRLKTQIVFVTDGESNDWITGGSPEQSAKALYAQCARSGPTSGFVILVGSHIQEMSMNGLIRALNNGQDKFIGDEGESREFCAHAKSATDIQDTFDLLTQYFNVEVLAAQMKYKFANDKRDKLGLLIDRQQEDLQKRRTNVLNVMHEELDRIDDEDCDSVEHAREQCQKYKTFFMELLGGHQHSRSRLEDDLKTQRTDAKQIEEELQNAEDTRNSLKTTYDETCQCFSDKEYLEQAQEKLTRARSKYSSLNPDKLVPEMGYTKNQMHHARIIFDAILQTFSKTCLPVDNMLMQLENTCKVEYDVITARNQLLHCYKKGGVRVQPHNSVDLGDNWKIIVGYHCRQDQTEKNVDKFVKIFTFDEFVNVLLVSGDPKELNNAKKRLEKKLQNELRASVAPKSVTSLKSKVKRSQAAVDKLEEEVKEIDKELSNDISDSKQERLERKKEALLEKLSAKEDELSEQQDSLEDQFPDVDEVIEEAYPNIGSMFNQVYQGLLGVFGEVMLRKGLSVTRYNLVDIAQMFQQSVLPFCVEAGEVTKGFLEGSSGDLRLCSRRLAMDYQEKARDSQLLDQFMHLVQPSKSPLVMSN